MIKNNKLKTLISSLLILSPTLFGLIIWHKLPYEMVSHIGLDGAPDAISKKTFCVFGLPIILLALHLFCLWITGKDPKNQKQTDKAKGIVFWILPAASIFVHSLMYATALEMQFNPMVFVVGFLAFMFIFIGNYMPACRQNSTLGIKIKWTLENAENWRATHRFSGKVWFICGFLLIPCAFLPEKFAPYILAGIILPIVILPLCYSYLYHKKQVKEGTYDVTDSVMTSMPKAYKIITVVCLAAILIFVPLISNTGNIDFIMGETALEIQADFYNDISVSYDSIDDIEFREVTADGLRTNGFGSFRLLLGQFKNDEFGYYTRYTYYDDTGCVVITVGEEKLVIAGKTLVETRGIYDSLIEKIP